MAGQAPLACSGWGAPQMAAEPPCHREELSQLHVQPLSSGGTSLKEQGKGKGLTCITPGQRPARLVCSTGKGPGWGFLNLSPGKQASQTEAGAKLNAQESPGPKT